MLFNRFANESMRLRVSCVLIELLPIWKNRRGDSDLYIRPCTIIPRAMAQLETLRSYFQYLITAPYTNDDDPAFQDDCAICKAPFGYPREPENIMDRPVRLSCGHVFGLQCLAKWMLSPKYDAHCSYCRIIVVDPTRLKTQHRILTANLTYFEIVCLFEGQISADRETALLRIFGNSLKWDWADEAQPAELQNYNRLMMLWDEFLNSVHDDAPAPEPQQEPDVRAPRLNQLMQLALEPQQRYIVRDAHEVSLFYLGGIAVGLEIVLFWVLYPRGTLEVLLETMA